jgi:hypothetical protein
MTAARHGAVMMFAALMARGPLMRERDHHPAQADDWVAQARLSRFVPQPSRCTRDRTQTDNPDTRPHTGRRAPAANARANRAIEAPPRYSDQAAERMTSCDSPAPLLEDSSHLWNSFAACHTRRTSRPHHITFRRFRLLKTAHRTSLKATLCALTRHIASRFCFEN